MLVSLTTARAWKFNWNWFDEKFQTKHKFDHISSFLVHHGIGDVSEWPWKPRNTFYCSLNWTVCCQRNFNKSKVCFCFIWIFQVPSVGSIWIESMRVYICFCSCHEFCTEIIFLLCNIFGTMHTFEVSLFLLITKKISTVARYLKNNWESYMFMYTMCAIHNSHITVI